MIYGSIRVSTDRQTTENQRFEILKFADEKRLPIDQWVEETISSTKHLEERQLGPLLDRLQADDRTRVQLDQSFTRSGRGSEPRASGSRRVHARANLDGCSQGRGADVG
jgi:hypothetical protein